MEDQNEQDGRFRFENVLKSMVARLELYNGLAPIQEYGRHQTQASKKKKVKEVEKQKDDDSTTGAVAKDNNFNDQYYDLDDDFIDDDMMLGVAGEDDMGGDLNAGDTHIYSEHTDQAESQPKAIRLRD